MCRCGKPEDDKVVLSDDKTSQRIEVGERATGAACTTAPLYLLETQQREPADV